MVAEEPLGDLFTERKPVLRTTMHNAQLSNDDSELSPEFFAEHLRPVFANEHIIKIAQNLKYDAMVLENYGIAVRGKSEDTMIAHFVYRNDARHGLDAMAMELMHYKMIAFDELLENGKEKKKIWEVPLQQLCDYSAQDADITMRLYNILKEKMHGALWNVCTTIDFPLVPVLAAMERTGQKIDVEFLQILSKELQRNLSLTEKEIFQYAGDAFNINSPKQLQEILFTKLQLQTGRKTKTGFSTDVNALEEIRAAHPIVEKLLEYRTLSKLKSTYVDAIPLLLRQDTARVHTTYNQIVAATGRLSSSDPNLQNIPIRTELGRSIRKAFITENGWKIIAADYSQIELRIMAHISGDEGLQEAFRNGEDIHSTTAEKLFGETSLDKREKRRRAKEINFGIMYGMGAYGLSDSLNVTQLEAKEIISKYFERFPKVREFIETTKEFARTNGYVETLCGRRRYLPDIFSKNATVRSNAERQAINAPIQGTAADMIKLAMIDIHREITKRNDVNEKAHLLLQVHDELVFEVEESIETIAKKIISDGMKNALALSVPVEVDWGSGSNWFEAS
jgi:DNA polymerase-1